MNIKDTFQKNSYLITRLVIPLFILAIISFALSEFVFHDTLINLATEFVSIIITILYVDRAILQHRKKQWEIPIQHIKDECGILGHKYIGEIGSLLDLSEDIYPDYDHKKFSVRKFQLETLQRTLEITDERIFQQLAKFPRAKWIKLISFLKEQKRDIYQNLEMFSSQLEPDELTFYIEYKKIIAGIVNNVELFLPFLGVPSDQLPKLTDGRDPTVYTRLVAIRTAVDIKQGFDQSVKLVEFFGYEAKNPETDYVEEVSNMW